MAHAWTTEEQYWRDNYRTRPYAANHTYDTLAGGYRYGYDSAVRYPGRQWDEVEADLERGWNTYEYRGQSTWAQVKEAVRDAWDRITGRQARA
jgi:hypothetical protein